MAKAPESQDPAAPEGKTYVPPPQVKTTKMSEQYACDASGQPIKRGTLVRLLTPIFDGIQRIPEDTEIYWPHDDPPLATVAVLTGTKDTPLDAPAMTDGKPKADYIDPTTGEKPVIAST